MFKIKIKETTWNRVDAFGDHVRCKQRLCLRSEIISSSPCPFCCRFQTTYIFDDNLKKYIHCYHIIILWLCIIICHILILQRLVGLDNLYCLYISFISSSASTINRTCMINHIDYGCVIYSSSTLFHPLNMLIITRLFKNNICKYFNLTK